MDYKNLTFDTEGDVETKFVFNLLTNKSPLGLEYGPEQVNSKKRIKKVKIGKGNTEKYYFPDFIVLIAGLPVLIVEVKGPDEDFKGGYREARLYCSEINSDYPTKVNPCKYIISTNGNILSCGFWDSEEPKYLIDKENFDPTNPGFSNFIDEFSVNSTRPFIEKIKKEFRGGTRFWKPTFMLGGNTMRNQSVGENGFGVNLSLEYKYLFNPETEEEREKIIKNAYVESRKRLAHVSPIDRLIRNTITPSKNESIEISDTTNPQEILDQFTTKDELKNQICLLIGSVGSGKTTFIDYLHKKALPKELMEETEWGYVNLNKAPVNRERIYNFITNSLIDKIKEVFHDFDFTSLENLKKLFSKDLKEKEGLLSLLEEGSEQYNKELYDILKSLIEDRQIFLKRLIEFFFLSKNKLFITILDNCDKRNRDDQLLMFEVANWLKDNFQIMVFLPLRETTYDLYKNEPPLDTVIKDLVFRIDPPLLINVIQKRIEFALRELDDQHSKFYYYLSNGTRVTCDRKEVGNYLRSILHTLFKNNFFKKLLIGLTGRNIRRGLEIFLDFCKSGHLKEETILKMRTSSSVYTIPNHIISRVLLRGRRMYYDEEYSYIKNIFSSDDQHNIPTAVQNFKQFNLKTAFCFHLDGFYS